MNHHRALSDISFVALDVETTGLDSLADGIVEVGAIRFDGEGPRGVYEQLINPGRPIPPDVSAIHGITDEMVVTAPRMLSVLPELVEFFGDSVLLAHNAVFDIGFLETAFAEADTEPPINVILCTKSLARAVFPGLPGYGLSALARALHLPLSGHHRALHDASCCAELFRRCVGALPFSWDSSFSELARIAGAVYRFSRKSDPSLRRLREAMRVGSRVRITYRALDGAISNREITPLSLDGNGPRTKVIAFCHLRQENRTFLLECITHII